MRYGPACGPELATLSAKRSAPGQHDRASLFLVDLPTARDLLLRAKHLFVEAMVVGADISSNGDAQNTSHSCSQDQRLLEMLKVGPDACAGARRA